VGVNVDSDGLFVDRNVGFKARLVIMRLTIAARGIPLPDIQVG
jgi:hypothetical protein